jgi:hypothetical protein
MRALAHFVMFRFRCYINKILLIFTYVMLRKKDCVNYGFKNKNRKNSLIQIDVKFQEQFFKKYIESKLFLNRYIMYVLKYDK